MLLATATAETVVMGYVSAAVSMTALFAGQVGGQVGMKIVNNVGCLNPF